MSKDHHAEGQKDGSQGEYHPPHNISILDSFIQSDHDYDKLVQNNKEYDSGYSNARNQK